MAQIGDMEFRVQAVKDRARYHKGKVREHRQELHACMEQLAKLQAICEEHGIKLIIESEGDSHGSKSTT